MTKGPRDVVGDRILIAGIGNIFFGDDAFGVRLARKLGMKALPDGVEVVDFGIRGIDLAYALLDDYRAAILLDATPRGGEPGSLYLIEPEVEEGNGRNSAGIETHNVDPVQVLAMINAYGGIPPPLWIVGCEPSPIDSESNEYLSLSPPVEAALDEAAAMVESLLARILREEERGP